MGRNDSDGDAGHAVDSAAAAAPSPTAAIVSSRPPLLILYGSQTGYAQEAAERIAREARCQHFAAVRCMAADQFERRLLPAQPLVLFVCSTTGQGEVPDNCKVGRTGTYTHNNVHDSTRLDWQCMDCR